MSSPDTSTRSRFGPYWLSHRIAAGGMAEVYAGRRSGSSEMVAIKRLLPQMAEDPVMVRMFVNEGHISAQIHHPNVVRIIEVGTAEGKPFIAMELLEGHSLAELRSRAAVSGSRVPLGITLRILIEACKGLEAAHQAKDDTGQLLCVAHRDFTPDNIHVGASGRVKLIDFGIAKSSSLWAGTEPGTLKGKFFYMAPEMVAGRALDQRADIFAAGVMLYEQLCGRRPFTGADKDEVVRSLIAGNPKRPSEFDPSVPAAFEEVCMRAIALEPSRRYLHVSDFISALMTAGKADLAGEEEIGAYMNQLFPLAEDEQRQRVARAMVSQEPPSSPALRLPKASNRKRRWARIAVPMVAVLALGGGFVASRFWNRSKAPLNPKQRLEMAARADDIRREALLEPLANDGDATADQLAEAGELLSSSPFAELALRLGDALVARFPDDPRGHLAIARASIRLRYGKRAEDALAKAHALAPNDPRPDAVLAQLLEAQGKLVEATDAIRLAVQKEPNSWRWLAEYGKLLSRTGNFDKAEEVLSKSLQRHFDTGAATELGAVQLSQGEVRSALTWLRRAASKDPTSFEARYYWGAALFAVGDARSAERVYIQADKLKPEDPRALLALCQVQLKTNDEAGAQRTLTELATRFPERAAELKAQCAPQSGKQ